MSKLYIAYGSNLCKRRMRMRCPTARPIGKFLLTDARLVFRGVADLEYHPGESAPCGLWMINQEDEKRLDRYEGVGGGHYSKTETIELEYAGRKRKAIIYLNNSEGVFPPTKQYADILRQGYKDFDLDTRYLEDAIARSFDKQVDEAIVARRSRQMLDPEQRELVKRPVLTHKLPLKGGKNEPDTSTAPRPSVE